MPSQIGLRGLARLTLCASPRQCDSLILARLATMIAPHLRPTSERFLIQLLSSRLGKGVTVLAVMLIALLVVQTPVAMVDRALHASGQVHAANAFAGPLAADLADHDHDAADSAEVGADDRDPSPSQGAHHHHDGASLLGLTVSMTVASPWGSTLETWSGQDTSLDSAEPAPQKRPPKARLEHIA